jgi:hypothetical protein
MRKRATFRMRTAVVTAGAAGNGAAKQVRSSSPSVACACAQLAGRGAAMNQALLYGTSASSAPSSRPWKEGS